MPQRALPGATRASTAGSKVSTWMPTESMPMSATWSMTSRSRRRLELHLDRQPGGLLDRLRRSAPTYRAPRSGVAVLPVVSVASTAPSRSRAATATSASMRGGLLGDRAAVGKRDADAAEGALVVVAPVGAGLQHRAGHGVQVQQGDLPVRDAVVRGQVVVARVAGQEQPTRAAADPR